MAVYQTYYENKVGTLTDASGETCARRPRCVPSALDRDGWRRRSGAGDLELPAEAARVLDFGAEGAARSPQGRVSLKIIQPRHDGILKPKS